MPGRAAGARAAEALLEAVVLPPGAQQLRGSPRGVLQAPFTSTVDDNLIDRHSWWRIPLPQAEVLTFLRWHIPAGLAFGGTGSSSGPNEATTSTVLDSPAAGSDPAGRNSLQVTVVDNGSGNTFIRVDGQAIWYPARPAEETAPSTGSVTISVSGGPNKTVTNHSTVQRLADEFNQLTRQTPSTVAGPSCPMGARTLQLVFTRPDSLRPSVSAQWRPCSLDWSVHGPKGELPALIVGNNLASDALHVLGLTTQSLSPRRS